MVDSSCQAHARTAVEGLVLLGLLGLGLIYLEFSVIYLDFWSGVEVIGL